MRLTILFFTTLTALLLNAMDTAEPEQRPLQESLHTAIKNKKDRKEVTSLLKLKADPLAESKDQPSSLIYALSLDNKDATAAIISTIPDALKLHQAMELTKKQFPDEQHPAWIADEYSKRLNSFLTIK